MPTFLHIYQPTSYPPYLPSIRPAPVSGGRPFNVLSSLRPNVLNTRHHTRKNKETIRTACFSLLIHSLRHTARLLRILSTRAPTYRPRPSQAQKATTGTRIHKTETETPIQVPRSLARPTASRDGYCKHQSGTLTAIARRNSQSGWPVGEGLGKR